MAVLHACQVTAPAVPTRRKGLPLSHRCEPAGLDRTAEHRRRIAEHRRAQNYARSRAAGGGSCPRPRRQSTGGEGTWWTAGQQPHRPVLFHRLAASHDPALCTGRGLGSYAPSAGAAQEHCSALTAYKTDLNTRVLHGSICDLLPSTSGWPSTASAQPRRLCCTLVLRLDGVSQPSGSPCRRLPHRRGSGSTSAFPSMGRAAAARTPRCWSSSSRTPASCGTSQLTVCSKVQAGSLSRFWSSLVAYCAVHGRAGMLCRTCLLMPRLTYVLLNPATRRSATRRYDSEVCTCRRQLCCQGKG